MLHIALCYPEPSLQLLLKEMRTLAYVVVVWDASPRSDFGSIALLLVQILVSICAALKKRAPNRAGIVSSYHWILRAQACTLLTKPVNASKNLCGTAHFVPAGFKRQTHAKNGQLAAAGLGSKPVMQLDRTARLMPSLER